MTQIISKNDPKTIRLNKLETLKSMGINPYPARFKKQKTVLQLQEEYGGLKDDEKAPGTISFAGRIFASRNSGMFLDVRDPSGKIQVFCHKQDLDEEQRALLKLFDIGDIIGVEGYVRRTARGELTINAQKLVMLTKSLQPLPEKFHGLTDTETRYRKRYLDILVNPESKNVLISRSHIISSIRRYMEEQAFLEVETPMLQPMYGGAEADPFITHHNALHRDLFLRIAPELYLKRLLVGGLSERIFEINRNFRNEGLSTRHNPEFTMLEAYKAYADYHDMMDLTQGIMQAGAKVISLDMKVTYQDYTIDFSKPFKQVSMTQAVKDVTGLDFLSLKTADKAIQAVRSLGLEIDDNALWGEAVEVVFGEKVEHTLIQPTHVTLLPKDISPLAKAYPDDTRLTERFETYINGWEIANAFSELNDPTEQRQRMQEQVDKAHQKGDLGRVLDEDFLTALEHGMPTAGGLGVGLDRLVILLTNSTAIREVIAFPTLKSLS